MREGVRVGLDETVLLLDARTAGSSDAWFELSDRLRCAVWRLGSASYCLHEWAEALDEQADIDDGSDPGDEPTSDAERACLRARRSGRRNTTLWRDREPC